MMLLFQSNNDVLNIKGTLLKLISFTLLLVTLNIVPAFAMDTFIIGTVFDRDKESRNFYDKGIESALKEYPNTTIEPGDYSSNCDEAAQQTERLITDKSVPVILSADKDGCSSQIGEVANKFSVLHLSLVLFPTNLSPSSELWLRVVESSQESAYIALKAIKKPVSPQQRDNLIFVIKQLYDQPTHKVRVPFAPLREKPARPGNDPEQEYAQSGGNPIIAKLEKGDLLKGNAEPTASGIENHCKRDVEKDLIYDYVYTVDWICVKVKSSHDSSYQGKTGWIHKMLVEKRHNQ